MTDAGEWKPFTEPWYTALETLLGAAACKQLGFYVIPDDMMLSVVIPIYNEVDNVRPLTERLFKGFFYLHYSSIDRGNLNQIQTLE